MYEHNGGLAKKRAPHLSVCRLPGGKQISPHDTAGLGLIFQLELLLSLGRVLIYAFH